MTATANLIGNDNYETKFGFHDDEAAFFKANKGLSPELVEHDLGDEGRAAVDARVPPARARALQ